MFLYSAFATFYKKADGIKVEFDECLHPNGIELLYGDKCYYFEYSDAPELINDSNNYTLYFKRSFLKVNNYSTNVLPLGFQLNYSYKPIQFLLNIFQKDLLHKKNVLEIVRCLDLLDIFTNMSHHSMEFNGFPKSVKNNNGVVLYYTRLWDPDRTNDKLEKERRDKMNFFRINAVKVIKNNFPKSHVGLFPCEMAKKVAPDLILNERETSKKNYLRLLDSSDICIADDGLKDTLGWKIGEYVLFGKSIISTPINILVPYFHRDINYYELSSRESFEEIPSLIDKLKTKDYYTKMNRENYEYGVKYLRPQSYFCNLLTIIGSYK